MSHNELISKIYYELPDLIRNMEVSMGDQYGTYQSTSPDAPQIADQVQAWFDKLRVWAYID